MAAGRPGDIPSASKKKFFGSFFQKRTACFLPSHSRDPYAKLAGNRGSTP
jgi:hypothetical protein